MLTVTNAWNQRGWDCRDHMMGTAIKNMVGRSYRDFAALRRAANRLSESYATIEYHDGHYVYVWDGSPNLPGRQSRGIQNLGPIVKNQENPDP